MSKTTGCRLPEPLTARVQQAVEEQAMLESELVRRAIRFYIEKNPDGFRAFETESRQPVGETETYNPMEDV